MKVLVLQLKRIGDLILTAPALAALRQAHPGVEITLVVAETAASLLPAFPGLAATAVHRRSGSNRPLWSLLAKGGYDVCLDFTGTDRSAFFCVLSRAGRRVSFDWVRQSRVRALAYHEWVNSPVREAHTVDHYGHLVAALGGVENRETPTAEGGLRLPESATVQADRWLRECARPELAERLVLIHPGTARAEKYWLEERWAEVIGGLAAQGRRCLITGGPDSYEQAHVAAIQDALPGADRAVVCFPPDLLQLAALVARAELVISCDTAVVHLAAAFTRPQIALFGPTNPFHWRPRHPRAVVLSAAQPDLPLGTYAPRLKGAPMERISTASVFGAIATLNSPPF